MSEHTENIKRYCNMDKFAQSICENMALTEDEANKFISLLQQQSQCDVAEVKHGKWIKDRNCYTCSECGFYYFANNSKANYCPNCGAKMDKEENL